MATQNIGALRPKSEIIDEIHGRTLDLCGLAAVVDKLAESDPPGTWIDVFYYLRSSLNGLSLDLLSQVDSLRDATGDA